jgi:large subunit ribosomal protein L7/L12
MDTNERLERLRGLLYEPPSSEVWDQLCALFEGWEPSSLQLGLDYALPALDARWPDELRAPPEAWTSAARAKRHPPAWPLVRAYDVILWSCGHQKIQAIKELRSATGLGLKESKDLIESPAGTELWGAVGHSPAHRLYYALLQAGSKVEVRPHDLARPPLRDQLPDPEFVLRLLEASPYRKIQTLKVLRELSGVSLAAALRWVNEAPVELYRTDNGAELARWAAALREVEAVVEIVPIQNEASQARRFCLEATKLPNKIETIKLLRTWHNLGLAEAKALAERLPQAPPWRLLEGRELLVAEEALRALRAAGGEGRVVLEG